MSEINFARPLMMGQSFYFRHGYDAKANVWLQDYELRIHADGVLVRYRLWSYDKKEYEPWLEVPFEKLLDSHHYGASHGDTK